MYVCVYCVQFGRVVCVALVRCAYMCMYVCMQCVQFGCVVCVALVRCVDAVSLFCYVIRSLFYINKSLLLHYLVSFATLLVRCVDAVSLG